MSGFAGQSQGTVSPLAAELKGALNTRLATVYRDPGEDDLRKFPLLTRIVRALEPEVWEEDPTRALLNVMRRAVQRLPDDEFPEDCDTSWRAIGTTLCGFRKDLPPRENDRPYTYKAYVQVLKSEVTFFGAPRSFGRKVTGALRERLATALQEFECDPDVYRQLSHTRQSAATYDGPTIRAAFGDHDAPYVPRLWYHESFETAFLFGTKAQALIGPPGTGKSTLARVLALRVAGPGRYVVLDARSGDALLMDVQRKLGDKVVGSSDAALMYSFTKFLERGDDDLGCVVFDNVEDWALVEGLVPAGSPLRFVASSRKWPTLGGKWGLQGVGPLTADEAREMARLYMADVSEDELLQLAVLRGNCLAIYQVCRYLAQRSPEQRRVFLRAFQSQPTRSLDYAAVELDMPTLAAVYKRIIVDLEMNRETEHAVRLLELIVAYDLMWSASLKASSYGPFWSRKGAGPRLEDLLVQYTTRQSKVSMLLEPLIHGAGPRYSKSELAACLADIVAADEGYSVEFTELTYDSAMQILARHGLVEGPGVESPSFLIDGRNIKTDFGIHPLAEEILCELFRPRIHERIRQLLRAARRLCEHPENFVKDRRDLLEMVPDEEFKATLIEMLTIAEPAIDYMRVCHLLDLAMHALHFAEDPEFRQIADLAQRWLEAYDLDAIEAYANALKVAREKISKKPPPAEGSA